MKALTLYYNLDSKIANRKCILEKQESRIVITKEAQLNRNCFVFKQINGVLRGFWPNSR